MILAMPNVLTADELKTVTSSLREEEFIDGKRTAGWHARLVKHNEQLKKNSSTFREVSKILMDALQRQGDFTRAVRPKQIRPFEISRYTPGMSYGSHIDNPLMTTGQLLRSDVSLTLFLSSPSDYEGGELIIQSPYGQRSFKLDAGAMIVYPSATLHQVSPVTNGVRIAAVTWVQSLFRDPAQRELIFDLDNARRAVFKKQGKSDEFDLLSKCHANLVRMWSDI